MRSVEYEVRLITHDTSFCSAYSTEYEFAGTAKIKPTPENVRTAIHILLPGKQIDERHMTLEEQIYDGFDGRFTVSLLGDWDDSFHAECVSFEETL